MKNASHLIIQTLRILMLLRIHDAWKLPETRNAGGKVLFRTKLIYRFFSSAAQRIDRDINFFSMLIFYCTHCKIFL